MYCPRLIVTLHLYMRTRFIIFFLLSAFIFVMAGTSMSSQKTIAKRLSLQGDTIPPKDSLGKDVIDTTKMDSLELAIYRHNKAVDDSIHLDSLNRAKSNGIDAPVQYAADDSLVYDVTNKTAYLYGSSQVDYENMTLNSDRIYIRLDSNLVHAVGTPDSLADKGVKGRPQFRPKQAILRKFCLSDHS